MIAIYNVWKISFLFFSSPQLWPIYSQAVVFKVYPARLSLNTLICFFASLQSFFPALYFARNPDLWKLEWNMQLLTTIYCVSVYFYKCMPFMEFDAFESLHLFLLTFVTGSGDLSFSLLLANMVYQY